MNSAVTLRQLSTDVESLRQDSGRLTSDLEASNTRFEKWDGRLWGLTLGLIGTGLDRNLRGLPL